MYGSITGGMLASSAITITDFSVNGTTAVNSRSWGVARTPSGAHRWQWSATGPSGSQRGYAHSRAVAEVRAKRAYEELA